MTMTGQRYTLMSRAPVGGLPSIPLIENEKRYFGDVVDAGTDFNIILLFENEKQSSHLPYNRRPEANGHEPNNRYIIP